MFCEKDKGYLKLVMNYGVYLDDDSLHQIILEFLRMN